MAREAALLLYTSQEKEFKQAKLKAAETLGTRKLPSNLEVAVELDRIVEEYEGQQRSRHLVQMRKEALNIMKCVRRFNPRLIGSVWRGTAHRNSDIDIVVFTTNPKLVLNQLRRNGFEIPKLEHISKPTGGGLEESLHIYIHLPSGDEAEIIVRSPENRDKKKICEIYGDVVRGLSINQLEHVLSEEPTRRFIPDKARA
ncbi:MAG: nucleotidyltransferase domain-containing protein [Candidatus Bathyarchaeia archaeon]